MGLGVFYNKVATISPHVEVLLRRIYWKNIKRLSKYKPYGSGIENAAKEMPALDFNNVLNYLKDKGVREGSLLIVHSSYDMLTGTGLKPQEIIAKLRGLIGESGTLAMPAIRVFNNEPEGADLLTADTTDLVCEYDVKRTPVQSGLLPFTLMRMKDSHISHFPYNPLVAVGPLAEEMMAHNLDGEKPSAHGKNSSWKFCMDHDAIIVGLGIELVHHNTMAHVMEEAYDGWRWSDDEWYRDRIFDIIDENKEKTRVTIRERKPIWGTMRIAELNKGKKLYKNRIIEKKYFGEVPVCVERAQALRDYLQSINKNGFPYYKF